MIGEFKFDDKGLMLGIDFTFENKEETIPWLHLLNDLGEPISNFELNIPSSHLFRGWVIQKKVK